jgi:hypothetical protein
LISYRSLRHHAGASRSVLRGALRGSAVDKFGGTLRVGRGGKHRSVIGSQHFQPSCDIGRVIFARLQSKFQVGAQESGTEVGNQFLDGITFAPEAMPAEVTVEPGLVACPMGAFVGLCCAQHKATYVELEVMLSSRRPPRNDRMTGPTTQHKY